MAKDISELNNEELRTVCNSYLKDIGNAKIIPNKHGLMPSIETYYNTLYETTTVKNMLVNTSIHIPRECMNLTVLQQINRSCAFNGNIEGINIPNGVLIEVIYTKRI